MRVVCLMPTFGRPRELIENSIALFERQSLDGVTSCHLLIGDDLGTLPITAAGDARHGWIVHRFPSRCSSLPAKYDAMVRLRPHADAFVVWDDDDIYLPHHVRAHAAELERHPWSHPRRVRSTYAQDAAGLPAIEPAAGRFHGALAMRREALDAVGGWLGVVPVTQPTIATFDQLMIASLQSLFGAPAHPDAGQPISYIYGWRRAHHCSVLMGRSDWYERHADNAHSSCYASLIPALDAQSADLLAQLT